MTLMLVPLTNRNLKSKFFKDSIDHNLGLPTFVTADVSMSNSITVFQPVVDLNITLIKNSRYVFTSCLFYSSPAAADIQIRFDFFFSSSVMVAWGDGATAATGGNLTTATRVVASSGGLDAITPSGWIQVDGAAIPLRVLFTQNTASASATALKSGSWLHFVKVA